MQMLRKGRKIHQWCHKITTGPQKGFSKNKIASRTDHHWLRILMLSNCANQTCVDRRSHKLNFVSCTTSPFGLGSFLDSIEHDFINFIRIWSLRRERHNKIAWLDKHLTSKPVMVSCGLNFHKKQLYYLLKTPQR